MVQSSPGEHGLNSWTGHELDRRRHLLLNPASQFAIVKTFLCSAFADLQQPEFSCTSNGVGRGPEGRGCIGKLGTRLAWFQLYFVCRSILCSAFFPSFS